jgi:hypothetical protein
MEKIDENPTISDDASFGWVTSRITPVLERDPCTDLVHSVTHRTAEGTEMQHHRILILLFAATLVSATALAFTLAVHAEGAIVKLVSAENGKCPQPINGSLNQRNSYAAVDVQPNLQRGLEFRVSMSQIALESIHYCCTSPDGSLRSQSQMPLRVSRTLHSEWQPRRLLSYP